jgi:hypothetical protein
LRRAFTPGDKNYNAQFWYARQLCIAGKYEEARPLFATLSEARVPHREKTEVKGFVRNGDGTPKRFDGAVLFMKPTFGFFSIRAT